MVVIVISSTGTCRHQSVPIVERALGRQIAFVIPALSRSSTDSAVYGVLAVVVLSLTAAISGYLLIAWGFDKR